MKSWRSYIGFAIALSAVFYFILFTASGSREDSDRKTQRYRNFIVLKENTETPNSAGNGEDDLLPVLTCGKKYRIGILESGTWSGFALYLDAVLQALTHHGWGEGSVYASLTKLERKTVPGIIDALNSRGWSPYMAFPIDACYRITRENMERVTDNIAARSDLDMIIGLGTMAGKQLKKRAPEFSVPCVIMAVSNPLGSGILDGPGDSGRDNITGRVEVNRFKRQVQLFHDIVKFRSLGVVYDGKDPSAAQYAAIPEIRQTRKEGRSFSLVTETDFSEKMDLNENYIANARSLVGKIDAFYLTLQAGVNEVTLPQLVKLFTDHKIPTFCMGGADAVRKGGLMSIATNWPSIGVYNARKIIRIIKGAKPRELAMLFEAEPRIAINLATARAIGFDPPVSVLACADEIYNKIE